MKRFFISAGVLPLLVFSGCASLTGSQIASINRYSRLLEKNAEIPGTIITGFVSIKYDIELLNTGTVTPDQANEKLWNSYRGREAALDKAGRADASLKLLGEYAVALARLSSRELSEDIKKPSEKLGISADTLIACYNRAIGTEIPPGIGLLLSRGTVFIGRSIIRNTQADALREYVQEGDTLVALVSQALKAELDSLVLGQWVPALKADLRTKQEDLLNNLNPDGDYTAWYATKVNREAAALIARIDGLEKLARDAVRSAGAIRRAHRELLANVLEKKKIREVLAETMNLYRATIELYETWRVVAKPNGAE
ncbi:MAG: hypothetical protein JW699_01870 [Chitinispirillaceae bacterium]|nr:hypothetical protein [Chitinispirillaceae bacterium]